jgi:nucleoside-diphosphate-sugar epimerase
VQRWWQADLADGPQVAKLVKAVQPEVILHLAGEVVGSRTIEQVMPTLRGNLLSTVNLLSAAVECGCRRVVLTGSVEEPDRGDAQAVPASPYAASKSAATAYGRMFHALYNLEVLTLRVFMVYGPGQIDLNKLVPYVILSLLRGSTPTMSSGRRPVDWIYVDDVVEAFVKAAETGGTAGEILEIGSGRLVTVREIVEKIALIVSPDAQLVFDPALDRPLEQVRAADPEPAAARLDWRPQIPLDEGLRRTIEWYRKHPDGV